jgi:hypothetical protein
MSVPAVGELCFVGVSHFTSVPGFLDGYLGFCFEYLISSPLFIFVLGLYIHFVIFLSYFFPFISH